MISIIIPAYNEEKNIKNVIMEIKNIFKKKTIFKEYEIIVVDDGSNDKTGEIALSLNVKVIRNVEKMGYGYSLKKGILAATNETIVIIDADKTYPFSFFFDLYNKKKQGYDLVVGARRGKYYKGTIIKRLLRFMLTKFVEFIASKKIKDINSGFRIFDKETVIKYFPRLCDTFSFTTSQTLNYIMDSLTVGYVDIDYLKRKDKSKVKLFKDSLVTLRYIIESCVYYRPFKMFSLLSFLCVFLSIIGFVFSHFLNIKAGYILGIGGLLVSIIVFSLGLLSVLLKQIMNK